MKKLLISIFVLIFTFVSCFGINQIIDNTVFINNNRHQNRVNLVIDAGHGGLDAGTIGVDGAKEKDINLKISLMLYDFAMVSGINSFLIRDGDYLFYKDNDDKNRSDLYNRLDYINTIENATLISIHQNHFTDEREWGMQIWYSPNTDNSKIIADNILEIFKQNIQPNNNRLNKKSDSSYYLLHKASVPSVMVECGFMSNNDENRKLQDSKYQGNIAFSIVLGFSKYITEEL